MSNGSLDFATGIDTSGVEEGGQRIVEVVENVVSEVEEQSSRITDLLTNIPDISFNIDAESINQIGGLGEAYADIYRVIRENESAITDLNARYREVVDEINKFQNIPEKKERVEQLRKEKAAISAVIEARKKVIEESRKTETQLQKEEKRIESEIRKLNDNANAHQSLKARLKELKLELIEMEAAGQRGTAEYRALQEEVAKLTDAFGDAQAQANILANDQRGFAGVMSGLTGLSGAFSATQGVIGLFGGENENLQKIMLKVQSVMAITMGLQQVQQTLNKDSAFSLVTLNGLKEWWNKLGEKEVDILSDENDALEENIAQTEGEAIATEKETTAEQANTASKNANNTATKAGAAASKGDAAAKGMQATATHSATIATKLATAAMKGLKMAIISTGIGALVVLVGELVGALMNLFSSESKAEKEAKELNEINQDAIKTYAKTSAEIKGYQQKLENFNGTKEEEKRLVKELNDKYGEHMGYCDTVAQWKDQLAKKGENYAKVMMMEAKAQAFLNKITEAYVNLLDVQEKIKKGEYHHWYNTQYGDQVADNKALAEAEANVKKWEAEYLALLNEIDSFKSNNDLNFHANPNSGKGGSPRPTFDPKKAAEAERRAIDDWKKAVQSYWEKANSEVTRSNIEFMNEGLAKQLASSDNAFDQRIKDWKDNLKQLAEAYRKAEHDKYMTKQGATEEGWLASDAGKRTINQWAQMLVDANEDLRTQYFDQLERLEQEKANARLRIQQAYLEDLVDKYGSTEEKIQNLWFKYTRIMNSLSPEDLDKYLPEIERMWDAEKASLLMEDFKKGLNWEEVFGNLDAVATTSLKSLKQKLQDFIKTKKDLSPEAIKSIVEAIEKIDEKIDERSPFKALGEDMSKLSESIKKTKKAQKAYNKALKEGTEEEQKAAKATWESAQNAKQKALAEATESLHAAAGQAQEIFNVLTSAMGALEAFGVEVPEQISGFVGGLGKAVDSLLNIDLTKPLSIFSSLFGIIGGIGSAIGSLFNNDKGHEKKINKLQKQVDALQKSYDQLGKSIDKAYSKDASDLIEQQNQMLQQQKILIQKQIAEEEKKKHTDKERIEEWKSQIEEIDELIAENKEKAMDAIFGEDLKSAIDDFANAYAEAWASGEDRAKSAKAVVRNMMKQMVTESIKAAIQSSGAMERIRQKLQEFMADNVLSDWEQNYVYNMAQELQKMLDSQFGWADKLLDDKAYEQSSSMGGFQSMSEETGQELNGRFTAMQIGIEAIGIKADALIGQAEEIGANTWTIRDTLAEMQNIALLQLGQLESINKNTQELAEMSQTLERIDRNIQNI